MLAELEHLFMAYVHWICIAACLVISYSDIDMALGWCMDCFLGVVYYS